jgi:hypothetical protein
VKLSGAAAAAPTVARKRAALFSALQYAVELEFLPHNQLKQLKLRRPIVTDSVDRRVVVNHAQARALLTAVRNTHPAWRPASRVCTTPHFVPPRRESSRQGLCTA